MIRQTSSKGIELIKSFEGLRLKAYYDDVGVLTIGFGHTTEVKPNQVITEAEAERLLQIDLTTTELFLHKEEKHAGWNLNQNQFDALVSLIFNIGQGNFLRSTVRRMLTDGKIKDAADAFLMWCKGTIGSQKVVLLGLKRRREAERKLFLTK